MANFQVVVVQTLYGKEMLNILNFQLASAGDTYLQDFADALRASYDTHVEDLMTDDWSLNSVRLRQMDGSGPFTIEKTFTSGALAGSNTNEGLPTTVACLVSTGYSGPRPNRGRIYFPGLCENSQAESAWGGGTLSQVVDLVEAWRDGLTVTGGNAFLRIARLDIPTNSWELNNPVESVIGRSYPATIRNRRLG